MNTMSFADRGEAVQHRTAEHQQEDMMLRSIAFAAAALTMAATPSFAATHCRDAHGKFIKCADKKPTKPVRCKDSHGKFAKCGTPGAKPA